MNPYVVYLDPKEDVDRQRARVAEYLLGCDGRVVEEHIGGLKAAGRSAQALNIPLLNAKVLSEEPPRRRAKPAASAKERRAQERYEALREPLRQARLLGFESNTAIARHFTERGVPMPSGKIGTWQPIQVRRLLDWVGEVGDENP